VLLGGAAAVLSGRLLGLIELYVIGAGCAALVGLAVTRVAGTRLRLEVGRHVSPRRVHAGQPARVELTVRNQADRRTPVLRLHDPVSGTQGATVFLAPVEDGATMRSAYRLPTDHRGVVAIGPLGVVVSDPFGMASVTADAAPQTELIVLPRIDEIVPPPPSIGDEPLAGLRVASLAASGGDDFAALRDYVVGDDLRRVHWPSSARHDDLLVRQDEVHWQGRTTVVLDTRVHTHRGHDSFEVAVSAAASVIAAAWRRRDLVRLVTTAGFDSGIAAGQAHAEALLEFLAAVHAVQPGSLIGVLEGLGRSATGASVVCIVGDVGDPELRALVTLGGRVGSATVVTVHRSAPTGGATPGVSHPDVVAVKPDRPFADAWNLAMAGKRRRRRGAIAGAER
jgi:uncharacterized protein (DUF58 family)